MAYSPEHFGMRVTAMRVRIECGNHFFMLDALQEGPCVCPDCGRRFVLTWSANIVPYPQPEQASEPEKDK